MAGLALALAAAATFGTADFLGGLATRRASALLVTLSAHLTGAAVVVPVLLLLRAPADPASLAWGATSGVCGCAGAVLFFRALAGGAMAAAAPVTAIVSAVLPVLAGVLLLGERPGPAAWLGVGAGLLAVGAISRGGDLSARFERRTLALAVGAGIGFGLFFICLSRASHASGLWPLLGARVGSLSLLGVVVLSGRMPRRAGPGALRLGAISGAVDMTANALFLLATRQGELALVAVLTSLYPAATVLLALAILRERLGGIQLVGVALALLAVALIAAG
jgi:drug/metabolite transporter (DMT)-like permease